jgi:hypothetical protein
MPFRAYLEEFAYAYVCVNSAVNRLTRSMPKKTCLVCAIVRQKRVPYYHQHILLSASLRHAHSAVKRLKPSMPTTQSACSTVSSQCVFGAALG